MSTVTHTITLQGIEPQLITCEMDITPGYGIHVTGMDDVSLKECLLRSVTALQACGYAVPGRRIEITLRPSELRKVGPRYDLAIASLLVSASRPFGDSRPLDTSRLERFILVGELALDGGLRAVNGALQAVKAFLENAFRKHCEGGVPETKGDIGQYSRRATTHSLAALLSKVTENE